MSAPTVPIPVPAKEQKKKEEKPKDDEKAKVNGDVKEGEELVRVSSLGGTVVCSFDSSQTTTCSSRMSLRCS